ncbi:hypothetical protein O181_092627 [Austropuccinia psidii MF-1]|uniref:Uncharacterized protein n=1 Tax=Austropuccinia psidii MF-1 TaxID=1389203 RepID=A0A9Q3IZI3_9BASI|nr:hypothetical protein [Austropuccinia psidii MF-1]
MPSTKSGASYNSSSRSQKGHRRDYGRSQSVTEGQGSVDDLHTNELCHSESDNTILPSNRADTARRSLSGHLKASQKAYNNELQHKEYQILPDMWKNCMNSYLTAGKLLGHPHTCKVFNGWHPLMEKKNMMLLKAEWRKNNPLPPKQVPKTAPMARSSNSNVKKQPQAQNKGKGKAQATKPYSQGYRIPKIQLSAMENVFQMARAMMELQKKEEARSKYQK